MKLDLQFSVLIKSINVKCKAASLDNINSFNVVSEISQKYIRLCFSRSHSVFEVTLNNCEAACKITRVKDVLLTVEKIDTVFRLRG